MKDPREVQRGEPQVAHAASCPQAEERPPFAMGGGGRPRSSAVVQNVEVGAGGPRSPIGGVATPANEPYPPASRSDAHYDSLADAMLPPKLADLPAIRTVPDVSDAQRLRLRRAIEAYRSEA